MYWDMLDNFTIRPNAWSPRAHRQDQAQTPAPDATKNPVIDGVPLTSEDFKNIIRAIIVKLRDFPGACQAVADVLRGVMDAGVPRPL